MSEKVQKSSSDGFNEAILKEVAGSVKLLKYGQIVITIHNSRIVQVEKTEKIRFDAGQFYERGSGI